MTRQATRPQPPRRPPLDAATLRRRLDEAAPFERSAVLAEAAVVLGDLEVVYELLGREDG